MRRCSNKKMNFTFYSFSRKLSTSGVNIPPPKKKITKLHETAKNWKIRGKSFPSAFDMLFPIRKVFESENSRSALIYRRDRCCTSWFSRRVTVAPSSIRNDISRWWLATAVVAMATAARWRHRVGAFPVAADFASLPPQSVLYSGKCCQYCMILTN